MTNIAFWNTHKNLLIDNVLAELVCENEIDILGLCEYSGDINKFVLRDDVRMQYKVVKRIAGDKYAAIIYNSDRVSHKRLFNDSERYSIHEFWLEGQTFILVFVHLPSKIYNDNVHSCSIQAQMIVHDIQCCEKKSCNQRTAIIGDFNMDPYEEPLLYCENFHAYPDKRDTVTARTFQGAQFKSFYNPMWALFGDRVCPPGTYYYSKSGEAPQWHIFDQVIMRYEITKYFDADSLRIVTGTSNYYFADHHGRPDKEHFSDHFPIFFSIGG